MLNRKQLAVIITGMIILAWLFINFQNNRISLLRMDTLYTKFAEGTVWGPSHVNAYSIKEKEETRDAALEDNKKLFLIAASVDAGTTLVLVAFLADRWKKQLSQDSET